ncbi:hypothetical protein PoB_001282600 [Plakobranchus ocellatus]|uniref:Secreted protein n=1 Tax=Plakobranchus ocellatus TaxID=259542 RepID=A0AAV3YVC7_9GAST|nr:hypothetical protein PoB_001282600 [Plakobranchus ocellatus]
MLILALPTLFVTASTRNRNSTPQPYNSPQWGWGGCSVLKTWWCWVGGNGDGAGDGSRGSDGGDGHHSDGNSDRGGEHGSHHFSCGPLHFELFGDGRGWMFPSHGVALCLWGIQMDPGLLRRIVSLRRSRVLLYRDAIGVILLDILPQGQCINAARYCKNVYKYRTPRNR